MRRLAFLTLFTAACLPGFDTSDPSGPIDPPIEEPPAPSTDVTVSVRAAGASIPGVAVVFQGPDDAVLAELVTDATGIVTAPMPAGGSVTVIRRDTDGNATSVRATTYTGVKAGDQLDFVNPTTLGTSPKSIEVKLPLPDPDPEDDEAPTTGAFVVLTPCGSGAGLAPSFTLDLDGCGPEIDFFVMNENLDVFLAHRAVEPIVDLSQESVRQLQETTVDVKNVPDTFDVSVEKRLVTDGFLMFASTAVPANTPSLVADIGASVADQVIAATVVTDFGVTLRVGARSTYSNNTATLELANTELPIVEEKLFDGTTVTWTEQLRGSRDFAVATLSEGSITRVIAGSDATPSLHVPALPASTGVSFTGEPSITLAVGRATGGYDAVRSSLFRGTDYIDAAPMNGQISVSTF